LKTGALAYISIPEHLQEGFSGLGDFAFDPAIPLPIELPPDCPDSRSFRPESLSVEMIISGILLDLAENPGGENSGYYRNLAAAVKPNLAAELEDAAIAKEKNGDDEAAREIFRLLDGLLGQDLRNNDYAVFEHQAFEDAVDLISQGREDQGILKAKEFLERHPASGRGWFVLGWGLRRLTRWKDAASCFEKAIELGCANTDARNELAICLMETGNPEDAQQELEKALRGDPNNVKVISNMGVLAMKQGDRERADSLFRTVLELEPDDPIAKAYFSPRIFTD